MGHGAGHRLLGGVQVHGRGAQCRARHGAGVLHGVPGVVCGGGGRRCGIRGGKVQLEQALKCRDRVEAWGVWRQDTAGGRMEGPCGCAGCRMPCAGGAG